MPNINTSGIVDGGHDDFEDDGTEWKPDPKE